MKRLIAVLSGLLVLPAFAEVAPIYYDDAIEYSDTEIIDDADDAIIEKDASDTKSVPNTAAPGVFTSRNATGRTTSRAMASSGNRTIAPTRTVTTRGTTTRNASTARTTTVSPSRAATARATVSRASATRTNTGASVTPRRATTGAATTARAGTTSSIVQNDTVNKPLYTGRVGVRTSGVTSRVPTIRMAGTTATATTTETVSAATTTSDMDELAQVTDFCKAQYMQCMDNFCNVLDDNQGRCSCSANLKNYAATENALKQATEDLQDVAQKIQYIGLTGDEIETLFTQTEAELKMQNTTDNTQLKNDLDRIKGLIVDVKSGNATATDTGINMDLSGLLDFTISSTGFDLSSIFGGTSINTSSISNQRGEQLYKTATARCKASVLNTCSAQGVDVSLITNSYDLEIDKQCIAYERSLTETNSQMASTVRNAKSVLQKARLMVAQQKNAYDLRGCVNALDSCMQDEFVCGSDYENCLDSTGKWIVNGEVNVGSTPGVSGGTYDTDGKAVADTLYTVWDYGTKNVWGTSGSISDYIATISNSKPSASTGDMLTYLRNKIGYVENGRNYGMCASVLNKCQDLTYAGTANNKSFKFDNDVIKEYLQRTIIQIKAQQDKILSEYADSCISDVSACLSQNNYSYNTQTKDLSVSISSYTPHSDVAINACMPLIKTCQSATTHPGKASTVYQWLNDAGLGKYENGLIIDKPFKPGTLEGTDSITNKEAVYSTTNKTVASNFQSNSGYTVLETSDNKYLIIDKNAANNVTLSKAALNGVSDTALSQAGFTSTCDTNSNTCTLIKKAN